jgi:hypothetical protein
MTLDRDLGPIDTGAAHIRGRGRNIRIWVAGRHLPPPAETWMVLEADHAVRLAGRAQKNRLGREMAIVPR